jgi:hypothetical protein
MRSGTRQLHITEINRTQSALFGTKNRTFGPYLTATQWIRVLATRLLHGRTLTA